MTTFRQFLTVSPIEQPTIDQYAGQVSAEIADMWRTHGAGFVGDGFFRAVDPARAAQMLQGVVGFPEKSTVLFTTGLGDVVFHTNGAFLMIKFRYGVIDLVPTGTSFGELAAMIERPENRGPVFEWDPYPEVVASRPEGMPAFEQCYGYVPILAMGGRPAAENLQLSGLYEHIAVIARMAGMPQLRGFLPAPTS
ncbi:T6SS immunity protein Tdi1 domain-containing protein [Kribbella sp. CA-294648]|uniref:T6SS immunity protein Tdi1 domain-containing protein n=1 Tax=Kribbella sp. CA-294648 TaxID=3239948 RepID=UPI003D90AA74